MHQSVVFKFLLLSGLALLSACSGKPLRQDGSVDTQLWQQRQQQLSAISGWRIEGRIAVKTADDAWTATLNWQQQGNDYRIRILAAFQGTYEIAQSADSFRLTTAENETLYADDAESLMQTHLGWTLPVAALKHWVRGLPDSELPVQSQQFSPAAELLQVQQGMWDVELSMYKSYKKWSLPGKLVISNEDVKITILAKQWSRVQ